MRRFLAALTFLTVIPAPGFVAAERDIEGCKPAIPLVGLLVGALAAVAAWLLLQAFPQTVAAVALVLLMEGLSKGFHLDGLADTADGFLSSRPKERILEIMHDSHIGTMGVLAIFAALGLRAAAFQAVPALALPLIAGLCALGGRCLMPLHIQTSRYAREAGLGAIMFRRRSWLVCLWAAGVWLAAAWFALGWLGLTAAATLLVLPFAWSGYTKLKIGGATGDTIGACEELAETLFPLLLLAAWNLMAR